MPDKANDKFFDLAYEVVKLIPRGRVSSYGAIARYLGSGKSSRMVGWAMNGAFSSKGNIPAHRVVNRVGLLTGKAHFGDPDQMKRLLEEEGLIVKDDQVANFESVFWDPNIELSL